MANNIELKAKCRDLEYARGVCRNLGTRNIGVDFQTDIYLNG